MSTTINFTVNVNSDGSTSFKEDRKHAFLNQYYFTAPDPGADIPVAAGDTVNLTVKFVAPDSGRVYTVGVRFALFGVLFFEVIVLTTAVGNTDVGIPGHREFEFTVPITRPDAFFFPAPVLVELGLVSNNLAGTDRTVHRTRNINLVDPV